MATEKQLAAVKKMQEAKAKKKAEALSAGTNKESVSEEHDSEETVSEETNIGVKIDSELE